MSSQLQVSGEAKIRDIQGPVVANSGVITALDGAASQYVRGDGTLADFPNSSGGGSSVSYYLNSSVSQGTIGGVAYRELSKEPIIGAGTDIAISTTGYVASYLTDANDPDVLSIPGGNFNCEFYFSVNNNTGNPFFYGELYKYDGTTFTLLGSSVGVPEYINQGTIIAPYYFAIPVATAALALTDRLAIRIYVNVDGRTVTLHTENDHLCQVVTTLSKGMVSLNNLTDQSQFITTGTSGTNFAIVSSVDTHTFNLPVASAANTGKLSSTDWSTFNGKQPAGNYVTLDTTQTITAAKTFSLDILVNGLTIGRGAGSISSNTAIGSSSLPVNTTGTLNTAIGNFSLLSNTTGYGNTSVGHTALGYNTTGFFNAAIGVNTLLSNTTGTYNNALGTAALYNNTTGSYNTAIGQVAGTNNTTGSNNTYIGNGSGGGITTGSNNTIIGAFNGTAALANNIVLADGAGNVRYQWDGTNNVFGNPISGTSASFSSSVTASSLIKSGGTSSQFLKADGSVDSNTYLTTSSASSTYLPLTGGTLTGALSGTSATFSGAVNSDGRFGATTNQTSPSDGSAYFYKSSSGAVISGFQFIAETGGAGSRGTRLTIDNTGAATFSSSVTAAGSIFIGTNFAQLLPITALNSQFLTGSYYDGSNVIATAASGTRTIYNSGGFDFRNFTGATIGSSVTDTSRMVITSGGNVGIGTSSPYSLLNVTSGTTMTTSGGDQASNATIEGANVAIGASFTSQLAVLTNSAIAADSGGGIAFGSKYSGNAFAYYAAIKTGKDDATSGNFGGYLQFATRANGGNVTERMRITSGGLVLIGQTSGADKLNINGSVRSNGSGGGYFWEDRSNSANFYGWYATGNVVYFFNGSANAAQIIPSTGVYTPLSDINKKKDFENSAIGLSAILNLKPTLYRMKSDESEGSKELGFIAQEVKEFIPQAFVESGEDENKFIGLNYNAIVAALVKSVQEQQAQIEELKALINK